MGFNPYKKANEKDQREAVHSALAAKGVKITKTLLDEVMDTQNDLTATALANGTAIGFQNLGTLRLAPHQARSYKVPDGNGGFHTGTTPAGYHVKFEESDKLSEAIAANVAQGVENKD